MNKIKRTIILISVFVLFILIIIIGNPIIKKIKMKRILKTEQQEYVKFLNNPASVVNNKSTEKIKTENLYFSIEEIVKQYIDNNKQRNVDYLYNVLDIDYIQKNNIENNDNLINKIEIYKNESYVIKEIYSLNGTEYSRFYIKMEGKNDIYIIVNIDFKNETFSVIPSNEKEHEHNVNTVLENVQGQEKTIQLNKYNKYNLLYLSNEQIANKYYLDYKETTLNNIENAYNLIDENVKNSKFKNISEFEIFIKNISNSNLKQYSINSKNDYKEIICITDNGIKIIFKIYSVMNYRVEF